MIIVQDIEKPQVNDRDLGMESVREGQLLNQSSFSFGPVRPQSFPSSASYDHHLDTSGRLPPPAPGITPIAPLLLPRSYPKYPAYHHHRQSPVPTADDPRSRSPAKRFYIAFVFALLICGALLCLKNTLVEMASGGIGPHRDHHRPSDGTTLGPITSTNWTKYHTRPPHWAPDFPLSAETSFALPVASDELYLISRGGYQSGCVHVTQSTQVEVGRSDVRVDVRVAYHHAQALARATVHRLRKGANAHGVGIYTPTLIGWSDRRDRLYFDVTWTLPAPSPNDNAPLRIRAFTTETGNFAYKIGDLWQSVVFDDLRLETSNGHIGIESITLTKGLVTSSNGALVGHFNVADLLKLHTSNGPIQVSASLLSAAEGEGGRGRGGATRLEMGTSNGPITSSVSLTTTSDLRSGGDYIVQASTSNGKIHLRYDDAPLGGRVVSDARTSNGQALVEMHPTFEGRYSVSTSNSRAVVQDLKRPDPSGASRRRVVEETQTHSRNAVSGRVYWESGERWRGRGESKSTVQTSNGRAELNV